MIDGKQVNRIFMLCEPVDMRKSFTGLISLTEHILKESPFSGDLFVFVNKSGKYIKALLWDRTGFCIIAKKLEQGRINLPDSITKKEITRELFLLLFDGISV